MLKQVKFTSFYPPSVSQLQICRSQEPVNENGHRQNSPHPAHFDQVVVVSSAWGPKYLLPNKAAKLGFLGPMIVAGVWRTDYG